MSKTVNILVIAVLLVALAGSVVLYFQQTGNLNTAQEKIAGLEGDVAMLEGNVESLESNVASLKSNVEQAQAQASSLQSEVDAKEAQIFSLQSDIAARKAEVSSLEGQLSSAADDIDALAADLADSQDQVESLNSSLDQNQQDKLALEQELNTWAVSYESLSDQIYQKFGLDEDSTLYITPEDPEVAALADQITGGLSQDWDEHWADIMDLYLWITDNIDYDLDTPLPVLPEDPTGELEWFWEYFRTPVETITDEAGDCEDMATLLASLIASYEDQQFPTWCIGFQSDNGGHLAVVLPVEQGNLVILDPAGDYYTGSGGNIDTGLSNNQAVSEWLQYWSIDMPNIYVDMVFGTDFYEYFDSTTEFLVWLSG